jgi:tRNA1Val (adenine37-N6)-methyltransferase
MANTYFKFKHFTIEQKKCAMKVTTDACLFGSWVARHLPFSNHVLDIGGGTGLLSLMIAQKHNTKISSVEIEAECFQQLQENIQQSPYNEKVNAIHADILDFSTDLTIDAIVSNPPFYEQQLKSDKQSINQARHDASLLLEDLFKKSNSLLNTNGSFFVLLPFYRNEECLLIATKNGFFPNRICTVKQSTNHQPFRKMYWFEKKNQICQEEALTISNSNGSYTEDFSELLKDYYLYL